MGAEDDEEIKSRWLYTWWDIMPQLLPLMKL